MATDNVLTPYSTARSLMGVLPTWMDEYDAQRILSYQVYEQIYWNVPETFKLVARGSENNPIYVPCGRVIVDSTDRYTATGFGYAIDPAFGSASEQQTAALAFKALFDRERFLSKFHSAKRKGLIHGDWAFHIVADPLKPQGRRLSIYAVDAGSLFKVPVPDDVDSTQAIHIIDQTLDNDNKLRIKRQTYSHGPDPYDPSKDDGRIWSSLAIYDQEEWNKPGGQPIEVEIKPFPLDPRITAFPVYHIANSEEPGNPWGSSELRGFERIMAAVNQAASDEELALALDGLGMYATNSGPPVDEDTNEPTSWKLGPGRVVELEGDDVFFNRVSGVNTVAPMQDHLNFLINSLREGSGTPKIASGQVDVQVAESGVALAIQMSPMLSKTEVKDIGIRDAMTQMFYDLKSWLQVYEGINTGLAMMAPQFGPKLPPNVDAEVTRIINLVTNKIKSAEWARQELAKYGYAYDPNEGSTIDAESTAAASAADPLAQRAATELQQ